MKRNKSDNFFTKTLNILNINKNIFLIISFMCVLSFFFINPSYAQNLRKTKEPEIITPDHIIKVSFANQENSPKGKSILQFKSIVEEKTKGKVLVEIYPFSSLIQEENEFEALELGIIDIIIPNTATVSNKYNINEYQLFDLPYLFTDKEEFLLFNKSSYNKSFLNLMNQKNENIQAISFWGNGFKGFSYTKPLVNIEGLKDVKIGTQNTKVGNNTISLLKAQSITTLEKNLLSSLKEKTISATEITPSLFSFLELNDRQKYFIQTNHSYSTYIVLMNNHKLNTLGNYKNIIQQAIEQVQYYHMEVADTDNSKSLEQMKEKQVILLEPNEKFKKSLKELLSKVHEEFVAENKELMLNIYEILLNKE